MKDLVRSWAERLIADERAMLALLVLQVALYWLLDIYQGIEGVPVAYQRF